MDIAINRMIADHVPLDPTNPHTVTWIDDSGDSQTENINISGGSVARNIVSDDEIEVCTGDYPNALDDAVSSLNDNVRDVLVPQPGDPGDVFAIGPCRPDLQNDFIDFVRIDGRLPSATDYFCSSSAFACTLVPPRSGPPLYSFTGELLVIVNAASRDPEDDDNGSGDDDKRAVRRTIAHELGHAIGLGDHYCPEPNMMSEPALWTLWDLSLDSLMMCSGSSSMYPLQARDIADFGGLYKPNKVTSPDASVVDADSGSVAFVFDATNVHVEENLKIYRWHADSTPTNSKWVLVETFGPSIGAVTWTARNQPGGDQVYRIFSRTRAVAEGQCYVDDRNCLVTTSRPGVERIGVPTDDLLVTIRFRIEPVLHTLSVSIRGCSQ